MASVQNDNAGGLPLRSPPTTAGSNPGPKTDAANTFSGGAESQAHQGQNNPAPNRRRQNSESRTSRYRGVQWDRAGGRWRARLHTDRTRHIGYFETEEEAAMAWDLAVLRYFGEVDGKKKLNFGEASITRYRQEPDAQLQAINSRAAPGARASRGGEEGPAMPAYRGVLPHDGNTFRAVVMKNRVNITIGIYNSAEEAARAHDCGTIEQNGWGALTNFPISDYETDSMGRVVHSSTLQKAGSLVAQHQQQMSLPQPLHRQSSLPGQMGTRDSSMSNRMLRSNSQSSAEQQHKAGLNARSASVPNLHHLAAAAHQAGWHSGAGVSIMGPDGATYTLHHPQQMLVSQQPTSTGFLHAPGVLQPPQQFTADLSNDRRLKRHRSDDHSLDRAASRGTDGTGGSGGTQGNGSGEPGQPLGANSPGGPSPQNSADAAAAVAGVRQMPDGSYQAALFINLGAFGSYDEAVRAYDRAALMASGFVAPTHVPLADAVTRAASVSSGGPPQLVPAAIAAGASPRYRGVTLRGGSFLAALDIGGKAYELGPFATEVDAAKAYDKYSLMLRGIAAQTNFPLWEHLASAAEVAALVDAVGVVALSAADRQASGATGGAPQHVPPHQPATLAPAAMPPALPLLSPIAQHQTSAELQHTALLQQQHQQPIVQQIPAATAPQHVLLTHGGTTLPMSVPIVQVSMPLSRSVSMHSMPTTATGVSMGLDHTGVAVHSSLVRMPSAGNLSMPTHMATLPAIAPPTLPATTTSAAPGAALQLPGQMAQVQMPGSVTAAADALAQATQLEQQLAQASLPAQSHAQLARTQSVGGVAMAAAPSVQGATVMTAATTQDTTAMQQQLQGQPTMSTGQAGQAPSLPAPSTARGPTPPPSTAMSMDHEMATAVAAAAAAAADSANPWGNVPPPDPQQTTSVQPASATDVAFAANAAAEAAVAAVAVTTAPDSFMN